MADKAFDWGAFPTESKAAGSKGGFDWNSFATEKPVDPGSSPAQTAMEHFGNGAALGYGPQLQALASKPIYAALNAVTGQNVQPDSYVQERDANIKRMAKEAKDNPKLAKTAELAGGVTSGIAASPLLPEAGAASSVAGKIAQGAIQGAKTGAIYGAVSSPGDTQGEVSPLQLADRTVNAAKGTVLGAAAGAAAPAIASSAKGVSSVIKQGAANIADKLSKVAEGLADNATGATGKQVSQFAENSGRELLDRKIVRFGDNQSKIAQRAAQAVDEANTQIDSALSKLQANGVKVNAQDVYDTVRQTITKMKTDPSKADVAKMLESEIDNLVNATDARGSNEIGIADAEQIKRGYNRKAGNWTDPEKSMAGKEMYQTYREAIENAANAADPQTAQLFEQGKKAYGVLAPIEDAAEKRAATQSQSQVGNFGDVMALIAGGPKGVVAKKALGLLGSRASSSLAVTADSAASALRKVPELAELEIKQPAVFQAIVSRINSTEGSPATKAADQSPPTKGPQKWANDGLDNLIQHAPDSADALANSKEQLMKDPKSRDLLIQASDLKPGSKAMQDVLSKIKNRTGKGA